jgi:hypothetical protein
MHPVVSGEAWLIAHRWGANPGVLVATIRNGKLETRPAFPFPPYWEQAFDYKLLLAVTDKPVGPPASLIEDFAYLGSVNSGYLKPFSAVYLSPPLPAKALGKDWPTGLQQIGRLTGSDLILAPPVRRTIRLLYPDGRPWAGAWVPISLYGSSANHSGVAVGIELGGSTTNAAGEVSVVAPNCPLALGIRYFETGANGPAGTAFSAKQDLIVGSEPQITVKEVWTLPEHDYVVRLRTADSQPIAHAHLTACINFDGCGAGCGPMRAPDSDASGTIRFRERDLRQMRSITVVNEQGKERDLSDSEMHDLLTSYQLDLQWNRPRSRSGKRAEVSSWALRQHGSCAGPKPGCPRRAR